MCLHCGGISGRQSITYCAEQKRKKKNSAPDLAQVQHKLYQVCGLERQSRQTEKMTKQNNEWAVPCIFFWLFVSPHLCRSPGIAKK